MGMKLKLRINSDNGWQDIEIRECLSANNLKTIVNTKMLTKGS